MPHEWKPPAATRPRVDHLVVALAGGDQAILILLLELFHLSLGVMDQVALLDRNDQVVLAELDAGLGGLREAEPHHPVGENHAFLLTAVAIDHVDDLGHALFRQLLIDQR